MKNLIFLMMVLAMAAGVNHICADNPNEDYVTVSFNLSATPTHWTNNPNDLYSQTQTSSSTSQDSWSGNVNQTGWTRTLLEDRDNSGDITLWDIVKDTTYYSESGTRETTTTTVTTTKTAQAVNIYFTLWDIVDSQGTLNNEDEFQNSWFKRWEKVDTAKATSSATFQVRKNTEEKVKSGVNKLNTLYGQLFPLQEEIDSLISQIETYRNNPGQDKQHTSAMSELAKKRKEEYDLKREIGQTRAEVLEEKGDGALGWTIHTDVQTNISETTTNISRETTSESIHDYCFVATARIANDISIEDIWKGTQSASVIVENARVEGKVIRSGYYSGPVYMFFDASGRALLPGAVTHNHLVLTTDLLKMKAAEEVQKGDRLICGSNEIVTVETVEVTHYEGYVYNLSNNYTPFSFDKNFVITCGIQEIAGDRIDKIYTR